MSIFWPLLHFSIVLCADINPQMDSLSPCLGRYCGRMVLGNGTYSECGACIRGFRPNDLKICVECDSSPEFYDWLYLGFMALIALLFHVGAIDFTNNIYDGYKRLIILHGSAVLETVLACIATVLVVDPVGDWTIKACSLQSLSDWYPVMYNPKPDYVTTLHCTQEIAYPFYSMVMIYYAFALVAMLLLRPALSKAFVEGRGSKSIYAALYAFPMMVVVQAALGGLLYYSFPYLLIVASLISSAVHLASYEQNAKVLIQSVWCDPRSVCLLIGHWVLHGLSIVALTQLSEPSLHAPLLALSPLPSLYYLATVRYTDPRNLNRV